MTLSNYVERRMMHVGATPEYTGYTYLISAIIMTMHDPSMLTHVTTELYPKIAQKYNTMPANVERSIRTIISAIWCDADNEALRELLGRNYKEQIGNAKFIGIVSRRLALDYSRSRHDGGHTENTPKP